MVVRSPFWCVAWLVSLILVLGTQTADGAELRAGAHAEPISPSKFPAPVNGGMKGNFATTVQDHMHARSLAISNGSEAVILCVVDACMIPRDICETAKEIVASKTGVARANLLISATHTHSAATLTPVFQSDPDPEYVSTVGERVAQGMIRAYENLEPAEIGWAKGSDPSQVFNRRWFLKPGKTYENPFGVTTDRVQMNPGYMNADVDRPSGPVDPDVWLLVARSKSDQRPIALFANYSLHYVGNVPPISADYFAEFAEQIGERLKANDARYEGKPPFVGIMSNGTSGNINNVNYAAAESPRRMPGEQIVVVAKSVADVAQQAYETIKFHSDAAIQCREADLQLGVRKPSPEDIQTARRTLETTPRDPDGQFSDRKAIYARETVLLAEYPEAVPVKLQALRIGDLSITAIPCEVFVEIGLELKQKSPLPNQFTISLANGYNGYLPTAQHHAWGGYETWRARSSYLEVAAAEKITSKLLEMLGELK